MEGRRPSIALVGAGRAGGALAVALHERGYEITAVASRDGADSKTLASLVGASAVPTALAAAIAADLVILAVPDTELVRVAATIAASGMALTRHAFIHCSARLSSRPLTSLRICGAEIGVMHPLQALTGVDSARSLVGASLRVEATGRLRAWLDGIVAALHGDVMEIPEDALDQYHAAAVLAGNAPLALLARATALLRDIGVSDEVAHRGLAALLEGAAINARRSGPGAALTGPVARGDADAVTRHLRALEHDPQSRELYRVLAQQMVELRTGRGADVPSALSEALETPPTIRPLRRRRVA